VIETMTDALELTMFSNLRSIRYRSRQFPTSFSVRNWICLSALVSYITDKAIWRKPSSIICDALERLERRTVC
jgi:hypothetical protein